MKEVCAILAAMLSLAASATSCGNRLPDERTALSLAVRVAAAVGSQDSIVAVAEDVETWIGQMDAVQAIEARRLLTRFGAEQGGDEARAVMLTMLHKPYWAGWELSGQCCAGLVAGTKSASEVTGMVEAARMAYIARGLGWECGQFDLAFQDYIDALPVVEQMQVYASVSSIPRLAAAVKAEAERSPVAAAEAVEALRHVLDADDFEALMNEYLKK